MHKSGSKKELFTSWDSDHNGTLSVDEIKAALKTHKYAVHDRYS